ncbi:late endosomal/lysosomal adaptor and MAPK and MTOR activator-domain-containing protein [Xylariomycetidae sp. FL2044]|nr:late endosomal/lysosomal adaptor and MAPK and MTOR activator-domain-containing protein [Xylariomycetidae sp. FL2044]
MGVCASCLGGRRNESYDEDDVSRLLFDDANNLQYGSFGDHTMNPHTDPLESQREVEALQRVVARTSNNLVDVFEIGPQEFQRTPPTMFAGEDSRLARYQNILSKLNTEDGTVSTDASHGTVEWLMNEDDATEQQDKSLSIQEEAGEPLVGTFADAVAR